MKFQRVWVVGTFADNRTRPEGQIGHNKTVTHTQRGDASGH